jgi:hypothetical protein
VLAVIWRRSADSAIRAARLDRVIDDLGDIKVRETNVEENLAPSA